MLGWIVVVILFLGAIGWSFITVFGNAMSDDPGIGFQGGWLLAGVWAIVFAALMYKLNG
jgi:hypothetical protein